MFAALEAKNLRWIHGKDALTYVDRSMSKLRNKLTTLSSSKLWFRDFRFLGALQETISALRESNASMERKYQDLLKDNESVLSDHQRYKEENEALRRKLKAIGENCKNINVLKHMCRKTYSHKFFVAVMKP